MSLGVSQIQFWLSPSRDKPSNQGATNNSKKGEGGSGATFLSYDVFMGLAIIGGFFALDHLYLRSPLTFLAKIIINILFFGVWWIYDAAQAVFNDDVVKIYGLGVPGLGPKGIGAGVLAKDIPDKKHMSFFIYALALMFGGLFGIDSFITGDKFSGIIRIVSLLTIIFAPVALGWWGYKIYKFLFDTKAVVEENYEFFGAPTPLSETMSAAEKLESKIPILGTIFGPARKVKNVVVKAAESAENLAETVVENPGALLESVIKGPVEKVASYAAPIIQPVIQPLTNTAQMALKTVDDVAIAAGESLALGRNALNKGSTIVQSAINTAGKTAEAAADALKLAPMAAGISEGLTPGAIDRVLAAQRGGGSSNMLSYALMGTFGLIIVSGLVLTYRRLRQNEQPRNDDSPPEPGVLRKSDQEKST